MKRFLLFMAATHTATLALMGFLMFGAPLASAGSLTLNATGITDGFNLSTFVTGLPLGAGFNGAGASSAATTSAGDILVSDVVGNIYEFSDADGQTVSNALNVTSLAGLSGNAPGSTPALANSGGTVYLGFGRQLFSLNNDGSVNTLLLNGALVTSGGLAANPVTGILYSDSNIDPENNLAVIDVQTNSDQLYPAGGGGVGAVSLDGSTVYVEHSPDLYAFSTVTLGVELVGPDFANVQTIQSGPYAGDLIGYDGTDGDLLLIDESDLTPTIIGTGGPTGFDDNIGIDSNNGNLLIPLGDTLLTFSSTPEPASIFLLTSGIGLIGFIRKRLIRVAR